MNNKPEKVLHTHNSMPTYTDSSDEGCVDCVRNQAIDDCQKWLLKNWPTVKETEEMTITTIKVIQKITKDATPIPVNLLNILAQSVHALFTKLIEEEKND